MILGIRAQLFLKLEKKFSEGYFMQCVRPYSLPSSIDDPGGHFVYPILLIAMPVCAQGYTGIA